MPPSLPPPSRPWRVFMWLGVLLAAAGGWSLINAGRDGTTTDLLSGIGLLLGGLCLAGWLGIRGARGQARALSSEAARAAQVLLVAELGRHDDATLERIAKSSGPAAEAARMLLQGRHLGNPAGHARRSSLEN